MTQESELSLDLKGILELAPPRLAREAVEERTARNALLRQRLLEASDATVAEAALRMGSLAKREFLDRLIQGRVFPMDPLFEAADRMASYGIARRHQVKEYHLIRSGVIRSSTSTPIELVVRIFSRYLNSVIARDTTLLEEIFNAREDREDIIAGVLNLIPKDRPSGDIQMKLELVRTRAEKLRPKNEV